MSGPTQNVGTTLTGGIQDISALLPLLGTDQCEQHVGSALDGGYLYAAAAPLSIFGCLGIVKAGVSILISSISIPKISISLHPFAMRFSQEQWLGARTLNNAGFKPVGTVAPLIAMDGDRYKAEMRLMEILQEKNIDNPDNLSIEWECRKWNVSLVLFTILAAALSGTPYIALLLQDSRPSLVHSPWIFPLLRTVGSCLATVCCQFLVQSRIISLMKNRIIFMVMNRVLTDDLKHNKDVTDRIEWLKKHPRFRWDMDLPAEQCLWSLDQFLSPSFTQPMNGTNKPEDHVSIEMSTLSFSNRDDIRDKLKDLRGKHFLTPTFDYVHMLISWIILCLSLPATVAGYIGCFTLVSDSQGNGPIFWLGLEAALSIVRILVWAWNPKWDEDSTGLTVQLKLTKDHPIVTTEKDVEVTKSTGDNTLALVPERRFLEWITPYTGPLEQFRTSESLFLYFTLTGTTNRLERLERLLYMTVFDFNKRLAVTLLREEGVLKYIDATVSCNQISSEMEASLRAASGEEHPWATNDATLFEALAEYYKSIIQALNQFHPDSRALDNSQLDLDEHGDFQSAPVLLRRKWSLLPKENESDNQSPDWQVLGSPTKRDLLYFGRGHEHHLKTELIENWSRWIVSDLHALQTDSRNDCHHALADVASDEAKWELTELDLLLALEWRRRELVLVLSSTKIEDVLKRRMDECIDKVAKDQGKASGRLREWMLSEFRIGRRKRLEKERGQAKERMEKAMKDASKHADIEGRPWSLEEEYSPSRRWEAALEFIDKQWSAVINNSPPPEAVKENPMLSSYQTERSTFIEQVRQRFEHWTPQRESERSQMDVTIKLIKMADGEYPDYAYEYPQPDGRATTRFVTLSHFESLWNVCAATVYDVKDCQDDTILHVINKRTTHSVINVNPALIEFIPDNDHLLYIGSSGDSEKQPAFIQLNRDQWWEQQTGNSSTFYFSPEGLSHDGAKAGSFTWTIAHIFIFLETPSRLRLRFLHRQYNLKSVSIEEKGKILRRIVPPSDPKHFRLGYIELDQLEPGRHELELVVKGEFYTLRNILIEFLDNSPSDSSSNNTGSNLATKVQHGNADAGPSRRGDTDIEDDRNAKNANANAAAKKNIPS